MKLLLATFYPVFSNAAGAEKIFWEMSNEFIKRGYEVVAVGCENKHHKPFYNIDKNIKCVNVGLNVKNIKVKIKSLIYITRKKRHEFIEKQELNYILKTMNKIISEEKPDIIISYQPKMTYVLISLIETNIPVITMFHNVPGAADVPVNNFDINIAMKKSKIIQVLMPSYIEKVKNSLFYDNVIFIPNPVPQLENNINYSSKKIICVGRIEPLVKRQHLLIEAFNKIKENYTDWIVEFYGPYSDKEYLNKCKALVTKYNLERQIYFYKPVRDIYLKLRSASIFAFPSKYEGFPLALTEAMSLGLPVIGYDSAAGVNELIIDGRNGFLCNDGVDDFAQKLKILMSDIELRKNFGYNAHNSMKKYAPKKIWDEWENIIIKVTKQ